MTINLAAAQARAEQTQTWVHRNYPQYSDEVDKVDDLARLVLDLVARVQDAELALAVYDEALVSEYWERWPPAESSGP